MRQKVKNTRWSDVQGALAVAVLESRARGGDDEIVVELPYVSARTFQAARAFMGRVAPGVPFALVGDDGSHARAPERGQGGAQGAVRPRRLRARGDVEKAPSTTGELFTDMNQWLLKVLLLKPMKERPSTLSGLQQEARAGDTLPGLTTVHRFVEAFTALGHVVRDVDGFRVVRRDALMRRWFSRMEVVRDARIPVRPFYGAERTIAALARQAVDARAAGARMPVAALAGFGACAARGVLHAQERGVVEVHLGGRALAELTRHGERVAHRDATLIALPSAAASTSIYGPLTWEPSRAEALPAVDLIQAALDVWTQPLGGKEQARYIVDDVLGWRDGE